MFTSYPLESDDPFLFGRLADGETAVGLNVDMTNIVDQYSDESKGSYSGNKYAAIFQGGNVGVGISRPKAAIHLVNDLDIPAFRVDTTFNSKFVKNAFIIDNKGRVGLGIENPDALLTIKKRSSKYPLFNIRSDNKHFFYVQSDGLIGIGRMNSSYTLDVSGNFRIGNSKDPNLITVSRNVGIGTDTPRTKLHVLGGLRIETNSREHSLVVDSVNGNVGINTDFPQMSLSVDGVVETLLGTPSKTHINDKTDRGFLARNANEYAFFGLKASIGNTFDTLISWGNSQTDTLIFNHYDGVSSKNIMVIHPSITDIARVGLGIDLDPPEATFHVSGNLKIENKSGGIALFVSSNGNVGIGTDTPQTKLDVSGSVYVKNLTVTEGQVKVSTLNIKDSLLIRKLINADSTNNLNFC